MEGREVSAEGRPAVKYEVDLDPSLVDGVMRVAGRGQLLSDVIHYALEGFIAEFEAEEEPRPMIDVPLPPLAP